MSFVSLTIVAWKNIANVNLIGQGLVEHTVRGGGGGGGGGPPRYLGATRQMLHFGYEYIVLNIAQLFPFWQNQLIIWILHYHHIKVRIHMEWWLLMLKVQKENCISLWPNNGIVTHKSHTDNELSLVIKHTIAFLGYYSLEHNFQHSNWLLFHSRRMLPHHQSIQNS